MPEQIILRLNWVDIVCVVILARAVYIGLHHGIVIETFKLFGVFSAVVIAMHYFAAMTNFLHLPEDFGFFVSFVLMVAIIITVFKFIRDGVLVLIKVEAQSVFDKWGGFAIGIVRGILIASLVVVGLRMTGHTDFLKKSQEALTGDFFARQAPQIYEACFDGFISKFFPSEKLNKKAFTIGQKSEKKKP